MESVRVRLVFEDRHILSKSQTTEGLKRSWLLFKPQQHQTISDLSSYLLHIFDLHQSCLNGLLLYMDGFVLPPFESTYILKDKDIICVKKKGGILSDIIKIADEAVEIVEKKPVHTGVLLLANEEFEKETGGCQSEPVEDKEDQSEDTLPVEISSGDNVLSKKRKASKKLQSSKKKKHRSVVPDGVGQDVHNDGVLPRKSLRKAKVSEVTNKASMESTPEITERSNNNVESTPNVKRSNQLQENGEGIEDVSHMPEGTRKISRSARRKKFKRQWLRELVKAAKKDAVCQSNGLLHWKHQVAKAENKEVVNRSKGLLHWKKLPKDTIEDEPNQHNDAEDDVVPVIIRPGHIRFERLGQYQAVQQSQVSVETFRRNGIQSKKKGKKRGKEKSSSAQRNDYKYLTKEYIEMLTKDEEIPVIDPNDFDKLSFHTILPKGGDIIAYRLLELSSTWTPELSSFRVGRILWYDPDSRRITLMPVPQYPVVSEKKNEDASAPQPDNSLYREDGTVEMDFSSLLDIRTVKLRNSDLAKAVTGGVSKDPPSNNGAMSRWVPSNNGKQTHAPTLENGKVNPWDQFSAALNEPWDQFSAAISDPRDQFSVALHTKKAQLSVENNCSKGSSGRSSLSYKALRSRAFRPNNGYSKMKKMTRE